MADTINAPFNDNQVKALNRFQFSEIMHPFTCPKQGKPLVKGEEESDEAVHPEVYLIATNEGWRCPVRTCEYTQDWAHKFMADPNFLTSMQSYLQDPFRNPDTATGDT